MSALPSPAEALVELIDLRREVTLLRQAIVRYGDRSRMATVEPMELQQAIDRAFQLHDVEEPWQ